MIKRGEKSLRLARAAATRRRQARLKTNRICVHTTGKSCLCADYFSSV